MSRTLSPSRNQSYGLARVTRVWNVSRASVYRSRIEAPPRCPLRCPGPVGACPDAELAGHIRHYIEASPFHGEAYRKICARLRFAGVRASPRRVRRVMGEHGLLAPHRAVRNETKPHDGELASVWCQHAWPLDGAKQLFRRFGEGGQGVGVQHHRSPCRQRRKDVISGRCVDCRSRTNCDHVATNIREHRHEFRRAGEAAGDRVHQG
jgi:putative transposase